MDHLMYQNCHYALDLVTDEELDIVANDILLLVGEYTDKDLIDALLIKE